MNWKRVYILAAVAGTLGGKAQPIAVTDSSLLQDVVITASRQDRALFLTPFSVETLTQPTQGFRLQRTTPEVLQQVAGVFVQKTNHGGGSPFLRGLTGNQTLMLIDGVRFNNAAFRFGPNQYLNLIDAFTIEKIEVVKGSGSVQYGSDALGGVVQVLTQNLAYTPKSEWHGRVVGRLASQSMEATGRAQVGFSSAKVAATAGYTYRSFGDLYGGDSTGRQAPSGYNEGDWNLKVKAQLNPNLELTVSAQQVVQTNVPLYHRVKLENFAYYNFDPQKMLVSYARLAHVGSHPLLKRITLTGLYKQSVETRRYNRRGNANTFFENDEIDSWGTTLDVQSTIKTWWSANSGVEWYHDKASSTRERTNSGVTFFERGLYANNSTQGNFSLFSLHQFSLKKWVIDAGLRYNNISNAIPAETTQLPGQPTGKATLTKPTAVVGNLAVLWHFKTQHVLYASASNGYRAPGIDDLSSLGLVDFRYEVPAYGLEPEKNINTEIGYRFKNQRLQLQATAFYMHLYNLISRVRSGTDSIQGFPVFIKVNDQTAFVRGFELSSNWQILNSLSLNGFVSYQFGQNLTRNEPMRRVPPINGLLALRYEPKTWHIAADLQWAAKQGRLAQGDKDDNRIPKGGTPGWQNISIYAGFRFGAFQLQASLVNLFNQDYRTHGSGINAMGRALVAQLQYQF